MDAAATFSSADLVSIIIPVYNTARYLGQCLESVRCQTHKQLQVIIIDDGSTDASADICDSYARDDHRFTVVHRANGGQASARNEGIDMATGRYIMFVDSDDALHPEAVAYLLHLICESGASVAVGNFHHSKHSKSFIGLGHGRKGILVGDEAVADTLYQHHIVNGPWAKLFEARLFDGLRFVPGLYYEDLELLFRLLRRAKRVVWSDDVVYYYRNQPDSFINTFDGRRLDVIKVVNHISDTVARECPQLQSAADDRRFSASFNIALLLIRNRACRKYPDIFRQCLDTIRQLRKGRIHDRNSRLKNRLGAVVSYLGRPVYYILAWL